MITSQKLKNRYKIKSKQLFSKHTQNKCIVDFVFTIRVHVSDVLKCFCVIFSLMNQISYTKNDLIHNFQVNNTTLKTKKKLKEFNVFICFEAFLFDIFFSHSNEISMIFIFIQK